MNPSLCFYYHFKYSWDLRIFENLPCVQPLVEAIALVWWINEFFRSFQIDLVIVTGKPRSGKGERLAHALLTLQLQCVSPCLQLCNVNTFRCSVKVLHEEKNICWYEYARWYFKRFLWFVLPL